MGMTLADAEKIDFELALSFVKKFSDEREDREIFEMSIHGIDIKKIPAYKDKIEAAQKDQKMARAELSEDEAKTYKGLFDKVLKDRQNGNS